MDEISVVLIKPDGVRRQLIGEIISRFEKTGLELIACKLVKIPPEMAMKHYGQTEEWFESVGEKLLKFYEKHGKDPEEEIGTKKPKEIGELVQKWNVDYLTEGKVIAMLWSGPHAIEIIRKIVGATFPQQALPGTIRGDYSFDAPDVANSQGRSIHNLIHASGTPEEAQFERELWFKEDEIFS
jgi:nucleoside-diphosphate kinase